MSSKFIDLLDKERLESGSIEMLKQLIKWNKSFKNSLQSQEYEVGVFELLNKRYIETRIIIEYITGLTIEEVLNDPEN